MFFATSFNNKCKACGWNDAKCLFIIFYMPSIAVLNWFLTLGKIQDGDHCCWCHRPPAVSPTVKYTSSCWEGKRLSTEGKIVLKYCCSNISKTLGRGCINNHSPPCTKLGLWIHVYVAGLIYTTVYSQIRRRS